MLQFTEGGITIARYKVTGMSCAACSARVERAVRSVEGVKDCSVNLLTGDMSVDGNVQPESIIKAVRHAGYGATLFDGAKKATAAPADSTRTDSEIHSLTARLIWSVALTLVLMYISMGHTMWGWPLPGFLSDSHTAMGLAQLLLAAAVMVIGQKFFTSGIRAAIRLSPNMDTLVSLGSGASFIYSTYILFRMALAEAAGNADSAMSLMHELYFESAAMILALITIGKLLEARAKGKTTDALRGLMDLAPKSATLLRDGTEVEVPVEDVHPGDIFVVRPGGSIPVDGTISEGECAVNESSLTGESIPVDKSPGDSVSAGTINLSGFIHCTATHVGEDTTLSQIIRMVSDANATKAPISKAADRVSGVFTPAVMLIAAVTFVIWLAVGAYVGFAVERAISVLVISCPCALGLATPVAIMVGSGVGARNGILFKTAASLEATGKVKTVALDKTGTITTGRPTVTDTIPTEGHSEDELLSVAYTLERGSEHPLGEAIVRYAEERGIKSGHITDFEVLPGRGLRGMLDGVEAAAGKAEYISDVAEIPQSTANAAAALSDDGKTPLYFTKGGKLIGICAVSDTIKDDSRDAIDELHRMGLRLVMLTGDNERTAYAIGRIAGVDNVVAGVLPDGKAKVIEKLKANGGVAMVGDGINDAPSLATADTGIAIGAGVDIAIDSADVVLMKSRLTDVPAAIRLSRLTLRNIHENLFWAFIYNVCGIPLAAGVFISTLGWRLNPMFGAAAMSLSSFCVVMNALRLNLCRIRPSKKHTSVNTDTATKKEITDMNKTVRIGGMMCAHCEAHVKSALEAVDGVRSASANHTEGVAVIECESEVSDAAIRSAIENAGYKYLG